MEVAIKKIDAFNSSVLGREYTFASKGSRVKRNKKEIIANEKNQFSLYSGDVKTLSLIFSAIISATASALCPSSRETIGFV